MTYGLLAYNWTWVLILLGLFGLMIASLELGRLLGRIRAKADLAGARAGIGAIEAATFALLGLLIAFSFSGAIGRFEARRQLVIDEANAISSAYRHVELMAPAARQPERDLFRRYLAARIEGYDALPNAVRAEESFDKAVALRRQLWSTAVDGCRHEPTSCTTVVAPGIDKMFDLADERTNALGFHPPAIVFVMLVLIAVLCSVMAGFATSEAATRNWFYLLCFSAVIALTIYVIMEIEYPRAGFMRLDLHDDVLTQTLDSMR